MLRPRASNAHKISLIVFTVIFSGTFAEFSGVMEFERIVIPETGFSWMRSPSRTTLIALQSGIRFPIEAPISRHGHGLCLI